MTQTATAHPTAVAAPAGGLRRALILACPVLAALLTVVGVLTDPGVGTDGAQMYRIYAADPGAVQGSALAFHWAYAFWAAPALLLAPYVRARGRALATAAAVVGFVAVSSLPGFLVTDYYDSAVGQVAGVSTAVRVHALMDHTMWGQTAMYVPGFAAFLVALPLVALALWRAGRVRWWVAPGLLVAGLVYNASGATLWGAVVAALGLLGFAVVLSRVLAVEP